MLPVPVRCAVVGILNVTPVFFSDGDDHLATARAIEHGIALAAAGVFVSVDTMRADEAAAAVASGAAMVNDASSGLAETTMAAVAADLHQIALGRPLRVGASRTSFLGTRLASRPPRGRDATTAAVSRPRDRRPRLVSAGPQFSIHCGRGSRRQNFRERKAQV